MGEHTARTRQDPHHSARCCPLHKASVDAAAESSRAGCSVSGSAEVALPQPVMMTKGRQIEEATALVIPFHFLAIDALASVTS